MAADTARDKGEGTALLPWIAVLSLGAMFIAGAFELLPGRGRGRATAPAAATSPQASLVASAAEIAEWPESVRRDVEKGLVRTGFNVKQMCAAKATEANPAGRPIAIYPEVPVTRAPDGRAGTGEAWVYEEQTFVVSGGTVVEIHTTLDMKPLPRARP